MHSWLFLITELGRKKSESLPESILAHSKVGVR